MRKAVLLLIMGFVFLSLQLNAIAEYPSLKKYIAGEAGTALSWKSPKQMFSSNDGLWSVTLGITPNQYIEFKFLSDSADSAADKIWEQNYYGSGIGDTYSYILMNGAAESEAIYNNNHRVYLVPSASDTGQATIQVNWAGAPDVPTSFSLVPRDGSAEMSWTASKEYDVARYLIFRSTSESGSFSLADSTVQTVFSDSPLINGTTYFYYVKAEDWYDTPLGPLTSISSPTKWGIPGKAIKVVFSADIGDTSFSDSIYISGIPSPLSWSETKALVPDSDGVWSVTLEYTPTTTVYYKYVWGSAWESSDDFAGGNREVFIKSDTVISGDTYMFIYNDWSETPATPVLKGYSDSGQVLLQWGHNEKDVYVGSGGYEIYRSTDNNQFSMIAHLVKADTFIDTNVQNDSAYSYFIVAVDAGQRNLRSDTSNIIAVSPKAYKKVVFSVDAGAAAVKSMAIIGAVKGLSSFSAAAKLSWDRLFSGGKMTAEGDGIWSITLELASGWAVEYKYAYDPPSSDNGQNDEPIGTNRTYTVSATDSNIQSVISNWGDAPAKPRISSVIPYDKAIYLEWDSGTIDEVGDTGGFSIYRATAVGGPYIQAAMYLNKNWFYDTGLQNKTKYFYYIYAYDSTRGHLKSLRSDVVSATPNAPVSVKFYVDVGRNKIPNAVQVRGEMPDITRITNWPDTKVLTWLATAPIMENTGDSVNYSESWVYTLHFIPGWDIKYKYVINGTIWDELGDNVNRALSVPDTDTVIEDNWGNEPAKPTIYGIPDSGEVRLILPKSEYDVGGGGSGYSIYRSTSSDFSGHIRIAQDIAAGIYRDTGLKNGTRYYYAAKAVDGTRWHSQSETSAVISVLAVEPVSVDFYVDAGNASTIDTVYLSEESAFDLTNISASDYEVVKDTCVAFKASWDSAAMTRSDSGTNIWKANFKLFPEVYYKYKYFYRDTSNVLHWEPAPPIDEPFAYAAMQNYAYINVAGDFNNWSADDYILQKQGAQTNLWGAYLSIPAGTYNYKYLPNGNWESGANRSVTTYSTRLIYGTGYDTNTQVYDNWKGAPTPPAFKLVPNDGYNSVFIDTAGLEEDIDTVEIYRSSSASEGFSKIVSFSAAAIPYEYIDTGLTNGQRYYYRVKAYDSDTAVKSSFSKYVSAKPMSPIDVYFVFDYGVDANDNIYLFGADPFLSWDSGVSLSPVAGYAGVRYVKERMVPGWEIEYKFKKGSGTNAEWEPLGGNRKTVIKADTDGIMRIICNWGGAPNAVAYKTYIDSGQVRLVWSLDNVLTEGDEENINLYRAATADSLYVSGGIKQEVVIDSIVISRQYSPVPDSAYLIKSDSSLALTSFADTNLTNGETYCYLVVISDKAKYFKEYSFSNTNSVVPLPPVPLKIKLDAGNVPFDTVAIKGDDQLPSLNWNTDEGPYLAKNANDTNIWEITLEFSPGQEVEYKFLGNIAGDTYWEEHIFGANSNRHYTMRADSPQYIYNNWDDTPVPPTDLAGEGKDFEININWQKSASIDVAKYNVYTSLFSSGPYDLAGSTSDTEISFMVPYYKRIYYSVVTAVDSADTPLDSAYSAEFAETSADLKPSRVLSFSIVDSLRLKIKFDEELSQTEFNNPAYYAIFDSSAHDTIYLKSVEKDKQDSYSYIYTIADTSIFKKNRYYAFVINGVPDNSIARNQLFDTIYFKTLRYYKVVLDDTSAAVIHSDSIVIRIPEDALPDGVTFPVTVSVKNYTEMTKSLRTEVDAADTASIRDLSVQPLPYDLKSRGGDTYIPVYQIVLYDAAGRNIFIDANNDGKPDKYFKKFVTLEVGYPDNDPADGIIDTTKNYPEKDMRIFRLDTKRKLWQYVWDKNTIVNKVPDSQKDYSDSNAVSTMLAHLSVYTLLYQAPTITDWSQVTVFPNPFVPFDGNDKTGTMDSSKGYSGVNFDAMPANVKRIEIYTITGDLVRRLTIENGDIQVGQNNNKSYAKWDITNYANQTVASGIYIYVIENDSDKPYIGKIGVIK